MTAFAEFFKLKDATRNNFRLNTDLDAPLYIDLDQIVGKIEHQLGETAPKGVIEGDFGTGKSHVLRYVQHVLAPKRGFDCVYVSLSGFNKKADFYSVHRQIMAEMIQLAERLLAGSSSSVKVIDEISFLGGDMKRALTDMSLTSVGRIPQSDAVAAKQWLMISRLMSGKNASKAGYAGTLTEIVSPSSLTKLYRAIGYLCNRLTQKKLLLLIDEGEAFSKIVDEDAQAHIGEGMRGLFDSENSNVGILLGLTTPSVRRGTHPMLRSDVGSRVGSWHWKLQPLNTSHRISDFMLKLWRQVTTNPETYTFLLEPTAVKLLETRLDEVRRILLPGDQVLTSAPTQRNLLDVLSVLGAGAVDANEPTPIRASVIAHWLGLKVA